jgi:DNA-binding NtrC family response regulator
MRAELAIYNLESLREAALTLLREVESLSNRQQQPDPKLGLQEEVQRYETELIRDALQRTRGKRTRVNQRRAARLLGLKLKTLYSNIKRLGIQYEFEDFS